MNIKVSKELNKKIEHIIKYKFKKNINLLNCLSHPSFNKKNNTFKKKLPNEFERLEFLGDRVLGLVVSSLIYNQFKDFDEGDLTKKFSYLVKRDFLNKISLELELDLFLKSNIQNTSFKLNKSILSDFLESLIGAIYVDGGMNSALKFIERFWTPYLDLIESNERDPKTKLQEISQKKFNILPKYELISKKGPSHSPTFTISLKALNLKLIKTSGITIKDAEKKAAKKILDSINE